VNHGNWQLGGDEQIQVSKRVLQAVNTEHLDHSLRPGEWA
jgi:hypothetical protein